MLKLTYDQDFFHLEYIEESVESWLADRVILALRSATNINVQSSTAAFPIFANSELIPELEKISFNNSCGNNIELSHCDTEMMEVILKGNWITSDKDSESGVFITALEKSSELLLQKIYEHQNLCQV
ncbi:MAG: alr0857 family protein [Mastigocoleus sp.]